MQRYPEVEIDLRVSDRPVDLLGDGVDLAVRIRELADSSLKTRRLGQLRTVVYGAPRYLARQGRPQHPDDLARHEGVLRSTAAGQTDTWRFQIGRKARIVRVTGRFRTDDTAAARSAVCAGLGLGYGPYWQIRDLVQSGTLEIVLEDFEAPRFPVQAVFPPSGMPPAKTRLFADLLAETLRHERL